MQKAIISGLIVFAVALLTPQTTQAQGTTYLSNLGKPSDGNLPVGSDSWLAAGIYTGNDANGYLLNSIQFDISDASGNPSGFSAMLYSANIGGAVLPGSSLGSLSSPTEPATAGIYTLYPIASLSLLPSTHYFIVLTAATTVAIGAYESSFTRTSVYSPGDAWILSISLGSTNGSSWNFVSGTYSQFALNATPVPEPSAWSLIMFGSGLFVYARIHFRYTDSFRRCNRGRYELCCHWRQWLLRRTSLRDK